MKRHLLLLVAGTVLCAPSASAQEKGRFGMAMGFPGSIAAVWHVTDAVAIRPEIGLSRDSREYATFTATTLMTSVAASGILFVATHDSLRAYVSPRTAYIRSGTTQRSVDSRFPEISSTSSGYSVSGSMGAQYAFSRRFSAWGELELVYEHHLYRGSVSTDVTHGISTRSAAGVIVYF